MGPKKKLAIGQKVTAGEVKAARKRFTNGHKSFTAAEAKAMTELQGREKVTAAIFERDLMVLTRPRNPLIGELTPREGIFYKEKTVVASPLIPRNRAPTPPPKEKKPVTDKPGVYLQQLAEASISDVDRIIGKPKEMLRIDSLRQVQDNFSGELEFLRLKIAKAQSKVRQNLLQNMHKTMPGSM